MSVEPTRDRRAERRESTRAGILETAWGLARTQGLAGLSLRDVARKIGMRPPSLYWHFDSKHAIRR
jgi:AcrR family transcriptional regulator